MPLEDSFHLSTLAFNHLLTKQGGNPHNGPSFWTKEQLVIIDGFYCWAKLGLAYSGLTDTLPSGGFTHRTSVD